MDNFDNNNMGGFEPQKPFTEKPVQNNSMNTEQTSPVSEPETHTEQVQNVPPQSSTQYNSNAFGNNTPNMSGNANQNENVSPQNQNPSTQPWQYGYGQYPANWKGLSFETLDAIQQLTGEMPLVLHGGTGIPADMIKKAISLGVSKINVNTECQLAFAAATRKYIEEGKDLEGKGFDPRKLLAAGAEAIKATVKEKMELFGSVNKA